MKIEDVVADKFKLFERMAEYKRNAHIATVHHLLYLQATTGISCNGWDLQKVFGTGEGNELVHDKNQLNKKFFEHAHAQDAMLLPEVKAFSGTMQKKMDGLCRNYKDRARRVARETIDRSRRKVESLSNSISTEFSIMAESRLTLADIESRDLGVSAQISDVLKAGFYKFISYDDEYQLVLETVNPVVMTYKNPEAKVDIRIDLGRFRFNIKLSNMTIQVEMSGNNRAVHGNPHPYISSVGTICWGTGSSMVANYVGEFRIDRVLTLLQTLMTHYEPGNPYVALEHFSVEGRFLLVNHNPALRIQALGSCGYCGGHINSCCHWEIPINRPAESEISNEDTQVCGDCEEILEECNCDNPDEEPARQDEHPF